MCNASYSVYVVLSIPIPTTFDAVHEHTHSTVVTSICTCVYYHSFFSYHSFKKLSQSRLLCSQPLLRRMASQKGLQRGSFQYTVHTGAFFRKRDPLINFRDLITVVIFQKTGNTVNRKRSTLHKTEAQQATASAHWWEFFKP